MSRLSLTLFVTLASAFYFSAGLPWCLLTLLGCFSGHSPSAAGLYTALWLWGFIGVFAGYVACSPICSEIRSVARCVVAGYLVNLVGGLVVIALLLARLPGPC